MKRIERDAAQELSRFADLLRGNVSQARQALKQLLVDRVEFTSVDLTDLRIPSELAYGAILSGGVYTGENCSPSERSSKKPKDIPPVYI